MILLTERLFERMHNIWLATKNVLFFTSDVYLNYNLWSCQKFVMPLFIFWITLLLDLELNIIGKLLVFRWELIVLLLLQTFWLFYERHFMKYLSLENQANIIEAFNFSSRYLDDLFKYWQYLLWPNGGLHIPYWIPIVSSQFFRYRGTFFFEYVYLLVQFSSKFMVN